VTQTTFAPGSVISNRNRLWRVDAQAGEVLVATPIDGGETEPQQFYIPLEHIRPGRLEPPSPEIVGHPSSQDLLLRAYRLSLLHGTAPMLSLQLRCRPGPPPPSEGEPVLADGPRGRGEGEFPHPPFKWDEERRAHLRAELDALYAHLYGLTREELDYILDTFPIVRRKDEERWGEYQTKRLVLEYFERLEPLKH
jgi:hypothetical protein